MAGGGWLGRWVYEHERGPVAPSVCKKQEGQEEYFLHEIIHPSTWIKIFCAVSSPRTQM